MMLKSFVFEGDVGAALHYCYPKHGKAHEKCGCTCEHMTVFEKDHIHKEAMNEALSQIHGAKVIVAIIVMEEPPVWPQTQPVDEQSGQCAGT